MGPIQNKLHGVKTLIVILPGPAVTAATPTVPDNLATASAAKTALT